MNTIFMLMAEYNGKAAVELKDVCDKFGLNSKTANERASRSALPVPVFRLESSQKAPWMVHLTDLAAWIDRSRNEAAAEWAKLHSC